MTNKETPLTYFEVIKRLTDAQTLLLNDAEQNPAKRQLIVLDKTLSYLKETPAGTHNAQTVLELLTALSTFNLTDTERINLVNMRPLSSIDVQVIIEEAVDRFDEAEIDKIATLSKNIFPTQDT
uniref:DNA-directed RNA polymerase III subunit RPC9 n=1 Tax=Strongyloides papillosus TaxID=174720 RepID=A0A0N5BE55_STREA